VGEQLGVRFELAGDAAWDDVTAGGLRDGLGLWAAVRRLGEQSGYEPVAVSPGTVTLRRVDVRGEKTVRRSLVAGEQGEMLVRLPEGFAASVARDAQRARLTLRPVSTQLRLEVLPDPRLIEQAIYVTAVAARATAVYPVQRGGAVQTLRSPVRQVRGIDPATGFEGGVATLAIPLEAAGVYVLGTPSALERFQLLLRLVVATDVQDLQPGEGADAKQSAGPWQLEFTASEDPPDSRSKSAASARVVVPRGDAALSDWLQLYHVLQRSAMRRGEAAASSMILVGQTDTPVEPGETAVADRYRMLVRFEPGAAGEVTWRLPVMWTEVKAGVRWRDAVAVKLPAVDDERRE